jgi:hypothetical protein
MDNSTASHGIYRALMAFETDYFIAPNSWMRDPNLSFKAKGLLAYFMTHTAGYSITFDQIVAQTSDGKTAIRSAVEELVERGYLVVVKTRTQQGYNSHSSYILTDPEKPNSENPTLENPTLENRNAYKKNNIKEEQLVKKNNNLTKTKKASRFSEDADLPDSWIEFVQTETPHLNAYAVFAEFKDYWIGVAGQRGYKLDWDATWRNWCRKQAKPRTNASFKEQRHNEARDGFIRAMSEQRELGE